MEKIISIGAIRRNRRAAWEARIIETVRQKLKAVDDTNLAPAEEKLKDYADVISVIMKEPHYKERRERKKNDF